MSWRFPAAVAALVLVSGILPTTAAGAAAVHLRGVAVAGLFGESDEEKAARLKAEQRESDQDSGIADLRQRVQTLEEALRQATGQNEELAHRIQVLTDRIERQQKDFDYKLCTLAAQQLGTAAAPDTSGNGLPCDTNAAMSSLATPAGQTPVPPAKTPEQLGNGGTLGTLPADNGDAAKAQYDAAMNLLARARYDEARASFRSFADGNPKNPLAPQAIYWVGNIAYAQKDYAAAAQAFAEQIKKYPTSPQGAESMLKLGQSLIAMGEKKEGCLTLGAIKSKYKQAPGGVLSLAASVRAASCPR